ncbi:MAG: RIP metalloprotease [Rhodospirillaceae bacterium]|nr:RIP metalloprotease [Rhodospirillaceae bacterium]
MDGVWILVGVAFVAFFALVGAIVFVHELGHYVAARACGVAVQAFSIGFGRELVGWTDRAGTRWRLCLLPVGGYVKMSGEAGPEEPGPAGRRAGFCHRPLRQRALIVLAGPLANLAFAAVTIAALCLAFGRSIPSPEIGAVAAGSPGEAAGFRPGDRILAVAGRPVDSFAAFAAAAAALGGAPVVVMVRRGDRTEQLMLGADDGRWDGTFGLVSKGRERVSSGLTDALAYGVRTTGRLAVATLEALGDLLRGGAAAQAIAGPLRFAQVSGQVTLDLGLGALVLLAALLSVNVAVFNLLPIPALDGGHLAFLSLEKLRGRPLPRRVQQMCSLGGLAVIFLLCTLMTANDLVNLLN